ncbi:TlpA family protein disulfide reductase [Chitinophaga qingshengii]|uniref:Redoxin domain-containing protein n=1 Tax=Chitinophaga qingshengii TaxID=1569794 RepID=A0ABR7TYD9_9BACT|nr:TlpA family protein disulfide reductase [Chitinophaga qingshengii]MBC9934529.1 redoxin domain-containing protein [Chitinophaga qingshengii]
MDTRSILFSLIILCIGCNRPVADKQIDIIGHVKHIPHGKVYLTSAFHWDVFQDSAVVRNDSFHFRIKVPASFEPYYAGISYIDTTGRIRGFQFIDPVQTTEKQIHSQNAFVLEPGVTTITGELVCQGEGDSYYCKGLEIKSGKETALMYQLQTTSFGALGRRDSSNRVALIKKYSRIIRENSTAYTLLQGIYEAREQYTNKELEDLIVLFDKNVQQAETARKLKSFMDTRANFRKDKSALAATDTAGNTKNWISPAARFNLLVFWASWCGPCRSEIPSLKKIRARFSDQDVHMVNISIDKSRAAWIDALQFEAMPWEQVKVDSAEIARVKAGFNFSAIPLTVLTDHTGKELRRYAGFGENTEKELVALLEQLLK